MNFYLVNRGEHDDYTESWVYSENAYSKEEFTDMCKKAIAASGSKDDEKVAKTLCKMFNLNPVRENLKAEFYLGS